MSEYGITGYGIRYSQIAKYIDRQRLGEVNGWDVSQDTGDENYIYKDNADLLDEYLNNTDNLVEYSKVDDTEGYIMIWSVMPYQMEFHKDYEKIKTIEGMRDYIWEHIKDFIYEESKKEIYALMGSIDDIYGRSFSMEL